FGAQIAEIIMRFRCFEWAGAHRLWVVPGFECELELLSGRPGLAELAQENPQLAMPAGEVDAVEEFAWIVLNQPPIPDNRFSVSLLGLLATADRRKRGCHLPCCGDGAQAQLGARSISSDKIAARF